MEVKTNVKTRRQARIPLRHKLMLLAAPVGHHFAPKSLYQSDAIVVEVLVASEMRTSIRHDVDGFGWPVALQLQDPVHKNVGDKARVVQDLSQDDGISLFQDGRLES